MLTMPRITRKVDCNWTDKEILVVNIILVVKYFALIVVS